MKCTYSVVGEEGLVFTAIVETNKVTLKKGNEKQTLDVNPRDCFNTLISLFSLKDSWCMNNCYHPFYQIEFVNDDVVEEYNFDSDVPDNFSLFQSYIDKLVGESL